jgi:Pol polyprotein
MSPKQTATPPSMEGQGEPQTAIRRPSNNQGLETPYPIIPMEQVGRSLFRDSVESPTTFSTSLEDTPDISSHGSYYNPKPTPSNIHPRHDKGKTPLYKDQFNDNEPSDAHSSPDFLLGIIKRQEESINRYEENMKRQDERLRAFETLFITQGLSQSRASSPAYPAEEPIQKQVDRYEKKALSILSVKSKVLLRPSNYAEWHESFLVDAETIKARAILDERQQKPPAGLSNLDTAIWHAKYDVLLRHLLSTLSPNILQGLQTVDRTNLFDILDHYKAEYGISPAKERLNLVKALQELTIQGEDYRSLLHKFRKIMQRLQAMEITADDFFHDLFITAIKDYNKLYVDSQLDDYFAANQTTPINNLDLRKFQDALLHRSEVKEKGMKESKANVASDSSDTSNNRNWNRNPAHGGRRNSADRPRSRDGSQSGRSSKKRCSYCGAFNHTDDICLYKYPERATDEFRRKYQSTIKYFKEKHAGDSGSSDSELQRIIQLQPAFMAQASSAIATNSIQHANFPTSWHLDTCASYHMCPNRNAFTTYKPYSGDKIKVANDNFAEPVGIGKVIIEIDDGILELDEVRHVPSLGSNLVSYGQLDDQGFGLAVSETSPRFHKITTPQGDTFHAYRTKISNVYQIGERVKIGNTNQKSPAYSTPAIRHTPGSPPIRGEASNNKMTNTTTGRDRGRPIWSIQGPTGNRLPKRKKDNRVSLRGR